MDKRPIFEVDVNNFHVIDADANESISRAGEKREDDIRVTGELVPSGGWVKASEARARVSRSVSSQGITLTFPRTSLVAPPLTAEGSPPQPPQPPPRPPPPAEMALSCAWGRV